VTQPFISSQTVFELGREHSAQPFITMKNKRKVHEQKIADHHRKVESRVTMTGGRSRLLFDFTYKESISTVIIFFEILGYFRRF